jgi:hypothetical protein
MTKHTEKDGYEWYEFEFEGKCGIADEDGNVLTLPKYNIIKYVADGEFFELRKLQKDNKDTLIAIESKEHEKKIILSQGIISYEKRKIDEKLKCFYKTKIPSDDKFLYGVYDRNWNEIIPPIRQRSGYMEGNKQNNGDSKYYPNWDGKGVERFVVVYKYGRNNLDTDIPLQIIMDTNGITRRLDEDVEYINLYEVIKVEHEFFTNNVTGSSHIGLYPCFMIYSDFVLKKSFHNKYDYDRTEISQKIFKNVHKFQWPNLGEQIATTYLYIDNNYDIREFFGDNSYLTYSYDQQYDSSGAPIIWSIYDNLNKDRIEYHAKLLNLLENEISDDAKLWGIMKISANEHFWNKEITSEDRKAIEQSYVEEHKHEVDELKEKLANLLNPFEFKTKTGRNRIQNNNNYDGSSSYYYNVPQQNYYYDGSVQSGYDSQPQQEAKQPTKQRRKCDHCKNGRMLIERSISVTTFGIKINNKTCSECGQTYDANEWAHFHQPCNYCGGKGYIEY